MQRNRILVLIVLVSLVSFPVWSASLDEARSLHENGQTAEALAAIEGLLGSDAPGDQKAEALDLLGTIAVDKGYFSMAKQAWSQLQDEYPDFAGENDVATKLLLVSALLKSGESAAPVKVAEEPMKAVEPVVEPEISETPAAAAVAAPAEAAEPAETPAPAPPAAPKAAPKPAEAVPTPTASETPGLVLVVGRGRPYDAIAETNDWVIRYLRERGVDAASATGGIPVVEESQMVLPFLLQKAQEDGAGSVLVIKADFARMQKIVMECYLPEGVSLWKVKVSGGTGKKGRKYSKTGINEDLVERFLGKLDPKVGGPGLPVTLK